MYARIIKITFPNEFAKNSADMFLNPFVLEAAKDIGLLYRIVLTPKPEQRVAIQIYEDKSNSKATRQKFGDEKLKEIRGMGARIEIIEGEIERFDNLLEIV